MNTHDIELPEHWQAFQYDKVWGAWEQVIPSAADEPGVVKAYTEDQVRAAIEADRQARGGDQNEQKQPETRANTGLGGGDQRAAFEAQIRDIFLANGFTIKSGEVDLKPYVYQAARALLEADQADMERVKRLTAELADCRDRIGSLETIIAACRDAVPLPPSGSEQEKFWPDAMSDASCVPAYIAAGFSVVRLAALAEAASVISDHNREGRQWVPGSLWGTITQECAARINSLSETHAFRLQYIEGVGTVAVMEPK